MLDRSFTEPLGTENSKFNNHDNKRTTFIREQGEMGTKIVRLLPW
jgi:hypothetical protein